jgi:hypothetical protein
VPRATVAWMLVAAAVIALFALAPQLGTTREELGETMATVIFAAALLGWALWLVEANRRREHWQYVHGRDLRAKGRGWAGVATAVLIAAAILLVSSGTALLIATAIGLAMLATAQLLPR